MEVEEEDIREEVGDLVRAMPSRKESAREAQAADSLMTAEEVVVSHLDKGRKLLPSLAHVL